MIPENPVVIVGAGLSGLTLAELLRQQTGQSPLILEKSRAVGGRMATRREAAAVFDHGAQFFKDIESREFFWSERWSRASISKSWFRKDGASYFAGIPGMTALAKDLAANLNLLPNEKVLKIQTSTSTLKLICESGRIQEASQIVLSCPLPQSLDILRTSGLAYPADLDRILYAKALVGLLIPQEDSARILDFDYLTPQTKIFSITNNQRKGLCSAPSLTVVMNPEFSENYFESPEPETLALILEATRQVLPELSAVSFQQLKKWRYSHPLSVFPEPVLRLATEPRVLLIGDAFGGPSLSGAVRSAREAAVRFQT